MLIGADGGDASIAGHDVAREPDAARDMIGVTGQFSAVDSLLTGEENLRLMADRASGKERRPAPDQRAARAIRPGRRGSKPATTYSGGTRRRLDLAMTLVGDPRIIFLDEPTTGLDPRSRRTMWQIIHDLVDRGVTILLTTHYLEEADQLADQVAVLDKEADRPGHASDELKGLGLGGHVSARSSPTCGTGIGGPCRGWGICDDAALTLQVPSDGDVRGSSRPARSA